MSLAKDDIGSSGALDALRAEIIKSGTLEKKEQVQKVSGPENEPEIKDVFEKKSNPDENNLEKLQEDYNVLEVQKKVLDEIDGRLERAENSEPEISEEEFAEMEKTVQAVLPEEAKVVEQKKEETPPPEEEVEPEKAEAPPPKEAPVSEQDAAVQKQESSEQINELRQQVKEKQQQIANLQQNLYNEVSSRVELKINKDSDAEEPPEQKAEKLKQSIVEDIHKEPVKSQQVQITNIDKDLLLALLSLRK